MAHWYLVRHGDAAWHEERFSALIAWNDVSHLQ